MHHQCTQQKGQTAKEVKMQEYTLYDSILTQLQNSQNYSTVREIRTELASGDRRA